MNELELKREFRKVAFALQNHCRTHQNYPSCNCIFYEEDCLIEEMMTEPFYGECEYLSPGCWNISLLKEKENK